MESHLHQPSEYEVWDRWSRDSEEYSEDEDDNDSTSAGIDLLPEDLLSFSHCSTQTNSDCTTLNSKKDEEVDDKNHDDDDSGVYHFYYDTTTYRNYRMFNDHEVGYVRTVDEDDDSGSGEQKEDEGSASSSSRSVLPISRIDQKYEEYKHLEEKQGDGGNGRPRTSARNLWFDEMS